MLRILYVEDNAANLSLVHRVARVGGHEVVNRTSGETALRDFDKINPDVVLMDIQLEGALTGLDVVRQLRADGKRHPIIAVTAYAMKGDKEKAIDAGCDDYLPKPLPIPKLVELLKDFDTQKATLGTSEMNRVLVFPGKENAPAAATPETSEPAKSDSPDAATPAEAAKPETSEPAKSDSPDAATTTAPPAASKPEAPAEAAKPDESTEAATPDATEPVKPEESTEAAKPDAPSDKPTADSAITSNETTSG
jgi:two-component system cell cycle response regulator DivK